MEIILSVALVTGLVQVIKKLGLRTKYVPLSAVVLGIMYAGFIVGWYPTALVEGIVLGLTSVGLYRTGQKLTD